MLGQFRQCSGGSGAKKQKLERSLAMRFLSLSLALVRQYSSFELAFFGWEMSKVWEKIVSAISDRGNFDGRLVFVVGHSGWFGSAFLGNGRNNKNWIFSVLLFSFSGHRTLGLEIYADS